MFEKAIVRTLRHFSAQNLRLSIGRESLAEIEKFILDGYTDLLFEDVNLESTDTVLVLGGYLGDSTQRWLDVSAGQVLVVEPVKEYFQILQSKFLDNPKVELFNLAVGAKSGQVDIYVNELESGSRVISESVQAVQQIAISKFLKQLPNIPKIVEINIEGGEYPVMQDLINSTLVEEVETLIIQFHRYAYQDEVLRGDIRVKLSETHKEVFSYDWVWERWDRKQAGVGDV